MAFLDSDYIRQLRYKYHENRNASISIVSLNSTTCNASRYRNASQPLLRNQSEIRIEDLSNQLPPSPTSPDTSARLPKKTNKKRKQSAPPILQNSVNNNEFINKKICCCLFGNQKNDFYQTNHNANKRLNSPNMNHKRLNSDNQTYELININSFVETKLNDEVNNNNKVKSNKKVRLQLHDDDEDVESTRNNIDVNDFTPMIKENLNGSETIDLKSNEKDTEIERR